MTPGAWLRLVVSDTGTGIAPDVLPHIFEPFYTTKGPGDGSGLGLAQVYGIVKQHDGYIDVRSQVGVGTTFVIYIPAIEVPEWSSVTALANILVEGHGETVLIVEDDQGTQVAIRDILEILDYEVLIASNGREALDMIDKHDNTIDLILSDLVMPEMGGVELYQQLLERNGEYKLVFMTGYPLGTETRELLDHKEVTWLQKPLRSDMLAQKIRDVLEERD
jgi:CheY-like chemotaxis protein